MFMIQKLMQIDGETTWDIWLSNFCTWVTDILHGRGGWNFCFVFPQFELHFIFKMWSWHNQQSFKL